MPHFLMGILSSPKLYPETIWTDSSLKGFGAIFGSRWLAGDWDCTLNNYELSTGCNHFVQPPKLDEDQASNINVLELYAVVAALDCWAPLLENYFVILRSDNMQVIHMITNHSSINKQCMDWLRRIFWQMMRHNVKIIPSYIPTEENISADALSRLLYFTDVYGKYNDATQHWP